MDAACRTREDPASGENAISERKTRFATLKNAWRSIGYDFDADAE